MLYFTIPSLDSELSKICGLTSSGVDRRLKRMSDTQELASPVKQRKCDGFSAKLDVSHFQPEDITIKVVANDLIVEGKHGERLDENGFVSRQFRRRYQLPENIDLDRITSKLTTGGKLTIEAPLIQKEQSKERVIPITFVNKADQTEEDKADDQKKEEVVTGA